MSVTAGGHPPDFSVIGAGLAGPLIAALLGRRGQRVTLWEMREDPRTEQLDAGKSINLALSNRGLHALDRIGLADTVRTQAIPMRGRMMHAVDGTLTFQPYGTEKDQVLYSVSRAELNRTLLTAAEAVPGVDIKFGHKCLSADPERGRATFLSPDTGEELGVDTGRIVGADGAFSRVRTAMQRRSRFDFRQDWLTYGYKELELPPTAAGKFALSPNALHIWPRRTYMMIALPNQDRTFTCTLFWPFDGPDSFATVGTSDEVLRFFEKTFPDAIPLVPDLTEQFLRNPVGSLVTVRCYPWSEEDRAVLVGDACHAVVPFYGQGMNAAFEDCSVLDDCMMEIGSDWRRVFAAYQERRKGNVDTLADLALANFVEMRDHAGTRRFLMRKTLERVLHRLFPRWYIPLYTMATFTLMPYTEAVARARRQDRTVVAAAGILFALLILILLTLLF